MDPATNPIKELFGETFNKRGADGNKEEVKFDDWYSSFSKKGKFIALYFGAHWAPPCRLFYKTLEERLYEPAKKDESTQDTFEIVFVTDDRDPAHYDRHILKMPWLSIPYENELKK